jgi:hypothetical protein
VDSTATIVSEGTQNDKFGAFGINDIKPLHLGLGFKNDMDDKDLLQP